LIFDSSKTEEASGAGVVLVSLNWVRTHLSFQLGFPCSNNQAEYEALIIGLKILLEMGIPAVRVQGDSQVVIKQITGEYKCQSDALIQYYMKDFKLLQSFAETSISFVPRSEKKEANELAQIASGVRIPEGVSISFGRKNTCVFSPRRANNSPKESSMQQTFGQ
jgi:ribonuclease HI